MRSASKTRSVTKRGLSDAGTDPEVGLHQAGKRRRSLRRVHRHPGGCGGVEARRLPGVYSGAPPRSHGLFSADSPADLEKTTDEINGHTGPVWTLIYSLKREDAVRLGYDSAESWRKLLLAHQTELAQAMKISPQNFRWRAAFHDEKHHPHIHMMA